MKFTYPRELSFAHPDYKVACDEKETPTIGVDNKTYLMVWNTIKKIHDYYCFEDDIFYSVKEYWERAE
jgi:hypothetical protein